MAGHFGRQYQAVHVSWPFSRRHCWWATIRQVSTYLAIKTVKQNDLCDKDVFRTPCMESAITPSLLLIFQKTSPTCCWWVTVTVVSYTLTSSSCHRHHHHFHLCITPSLFHSKLKKVTG